MDEFKNVDTVNLSASKLYKTFISLLHLMVLLKSYLSILARDPISGSETNANASALSSGPCRIVNNRGCL